MRRTCAFRGRATRFPIPRPSQPAPCGYGRGQPHVSVTRPTEVHRSLLSDDDKHKSFPPGEAAATASLNRLVRPPLLPHG